MPFTACTEPLEAREREPGWRQATLSRPHVEKRTVRLVSEQASFLAR